MRDLLAQAPGEAIRLALLSTHYRRPLDWNAQRLADARQMLVRFYTSLAKVEHVAILPDAAPDPEVLEALRNDLNVPGALTRLHVLRVQLDEAATDAARAQAKSRLLASAGLLGLLQQAPAAAMEILAPSAWALSLSTARVRELLAERELARQNRDFVRADVLRDELEAAGFIVEDTLKGMVVRPARKEPA